MFSKLLEWIRKALQKFKLLPGTEANLSAEILMSDTMSSAIDLWSRLYEDKAPWVDNKKVFSANLAASIASEVARLVTLEMAAEITGSARAKLLNENFQKVIDQARIFTEYAAAKGGLIFKPYVAGDKIPVDLIQADSFFPLDFDASGRLTGGIFVEQIRRSGKIYTRLERHQMAGKKYIVASHAYMSSSESSLGTEIDLADVLEWAQLQTEITIAGVDRPLFAYFKMPLANTKDPKSPLGVSVYARAVDLIRRADEQYSRILWEYEGGELAIDAAADIFKQGDNGEPILPKGRERLYRAYEYDRQDGKVFIQPYAPELRDESLFNGYNNLLKRIEFTCGLAYGTLSDPQNVDKTATEIIASKQRSYALVTDVQKALQTALEDLVYAMDTWATLYNLAPAGEHKASFTFDDSILNDPEMERQRDLQEVRDGLMQKWEYRMKWKGEDEATAKKMVAQEEADDDLMGFRR